MVDGDTTLFEIIMRRHIAVTAGSCFRWCRRGTAERTKCFVWTDVPLVFGWQRRSIITELKAAIQNERGSDLKIPFIRPGNRKAGTAE